MGNLYEQSKIFDVVAWGAPQVRSDLTRLGDLPIDTPSGEQVALKDVATVRVAPEPTAITHDDVLRSIEVAAKVSGDPGPVVGAVRSRLARVPMPYEYHAEVFGNATVKRADLDRTLLLGAGALIGVFLLLQAAVGSWRRAGLLLASLPLSAAGAVLAAPLVGGVCSTGALAGVFAVFALAIRASILLGCRLKDREQDDADRQAALVEAARERAVPVLQSVLATTAVALPAAVAGTRPGLEFLHPLAVTMLGGLLSLVVVQLFVLPGLLQLTVGRKQAERDAGQAVTATPA